MDVWLLLCCFIISLSEEGSLVTEPEVTVAVSDYWDEFESNAIVYIYWDANLKNVQY